MALLLAAPNFINAPCLRPFGEELLGLGPYCPEKVGVPVFLQRFLTGPLTVGKKDVLLMPVSIKLKKAAAFKAPDILSVLPEKFLESRNFPWLKCHLYDSDHPLIQMLWSPYPAIRVQIGKRRFPQKRDCFYRSPIRYIRPN